MRCAAGCLSFDETDCWTAPTVSAPVLLAPYVNWLKVSNDGRFVAFLTTSQGIGSLLTGPATGPFVTVGTQVDSTFKFSPDGNWLVFIDSASNSSGGGQEILKARPTSGGTTITLGSALAIWGQVEITSGNRVFFLDQFVYSTEAGRLRSFDLSSGQGTTVEAAASNVWLSPTQQTLVWTTNFNRTTNRADLKQAPLSSLASSFLLGTNTPYNQGSPSCAFFTKNGSFIFLDNAVAAGTSLVSGRLRSASPFGFGGLNTIGPTAVVSNSWCAAASRDGTRVAYLTSAIPTARTGSLSWGSVAGGPSTSLGTAVGYERLYSEFFESGAIEYLDAFVDGFNSDYGTMTLYRAGGSPMTLVPNVYGRYNRSPNLRSVLYASNFDAVLERGTLYALDTVTGANVLLATNAVEWAEYSPDSSKALYIAEHVASSSSGRLEIIDLPSATNRRVIANGVEDYRYEFTRDGSHIVYVANASNSIGDVTIDLPTGGAAQIIAPQSRVVMGDVASPLATAFTVLASPGGASNQQGTLFAVRSRDGARAQIDTLVSYNVWWLDESRILYVKSGGLHLATVTWR